MEESSTSAANASRDALANAFPDSATAVALIFDALRVGVRPVAEGDDDNRSDAIRDMLENTEPAVRTRVVVISEVLRELAGVVRMLALEVKAEFQDPDVSEGTAEVTEDGWLVVHMGDKEIGRMPFNPRRRDGTENKLATDIISEYVRLHVNGALEAQNVIKFPAPGRVTSVAVVSDAATDAVTGAAQ